MMDEPIEIDEEFIEAARLSPILHKRYGFTKKYVIEAAKRDLRETADEMAAAGQEVSEEITQAHYNVMLKFINEVYGEDETTTVKA